MERRWAPRCSEAEGSDMTERVQGDGQVTAWVRRQKGELEESLGGAVRFAEVRFEVPEALREEGWRGQLTFKSQGQKQEITRVTTYPGH